MTPFFLVFVGQQRATASKRFLTPSPVSALVSKIRSSGTPRVSASAITSSREDSLAYAWELTKSTVGKSLKQWSQKEGCSLVCQYEFQKQTLCSNDKNNAVPLVGMQFFRPLLDLFQWNTLCQVYLCVGFVRTPLEGRGVMMWIVIECIIRCCQSVSTNRSKQEQCSHPDSRRGSVSQSALPLLCPKGQSQLPCRQQLRVFHHMMHWSSVCFVTQLSLLCYLYVKMKPNHANLGCFTGKVALHKTLKKACLSDARHPEQDDLCINICLNMLYVPHWWWCLTSVLWEGGNESW